MRKYAEKCGNKRLPGIFYHREHKVKIAERRPEPELVTKMESQKWDFIGKKPSHESFRGMGSQRFLGADVRIADNT